MKRILLIVDPQNDFISGSLAVETASLKMNRLVDYINKSDDEYVYAYLTADGHTKNHCSFIDNGGEWPVHCVYGTRGAKIYEPLYNAILKKFKKNYAIAYKGLSSDRDQYSVFDLDEDMNITNSGGVMLYNALYELIKDDEIESIDVCGIAGDYCVLETLKGLVGLVGNNYISVLDEFTASIDGGKKLQEYLETNNINNIIDSSLNLQEYVR